MPKFQIWAETGRAEPNSREELNREAQAESIGRDAFEGALMPERVDRLTIQLRRGPIVIS